MPHMMRHVGGGNGNARADERASALAARAAGCQRTGKDGQRTLGNDRDRQRDNGRIVIRKMIIELVISIITAMAEISRSVGNAGTGFESNNWKRSRDQYGDDVSIRKEWWCHHTCVGTCARGKSRECKGSGMECL